MKNKDYWKALLIHIFRDYWFGWFFILMVVCMIMNGCSSARSVVDIQKEYVHDTLTKTLMQFDSIYLHDSTIIRMAGDTVYSDRWHTKYVEKLRHDTVNSVSVQYVDKVKTETKEVIKNSHFAKFCISFFWIVIALIVIVGVIYSYIKLKV